MLVQRGRSALVRTARTFSEAVSGIQDIAAQATALQRAPWPLLLTPGPLSTAPEVKRAMLVDLGSRDASFLSVVKEVRKGLLEIAGVRATDGFSSVLIQGSGTFAVESVLGSALPASAPGSAPRLLIGINGAYGERMSRMATVLNIPHVAVRAHEREPLTASSMSAALAANPSVTHAAFVHHETTAGVLNPLEEICVALRRDRPALSIIVDSMSAFGAYPVRMHTAPPGGPVRPEHVLINFLVSSANKCIEGVPGFAFVVADNASLASCEGKARSLSLDLHAQWTGLDATAQFRFTPPTHAILAFHAALKLHADEGGAPARLARYQASFHALKAGMAALGFQLYVQEPHQGCIISTFLNPDDPAFDFPRFYSELAAAGIVIYPGKLTQADCFRVGSIGRVFPADMRAAVAQMEIVLRRMNVALPVKQKAPGA